MKILLATHQLDKVGGTEQFTADMARALRRHGHSVSVFTFVAGWAAQQLQAEGFDVAPRRPLVAPDAVWLNHHTCLAALRDLPCPVIHTSHGPGHALEYPRPGADAYVTVSPEIADRWPGYPMQVIGNGVDLTRFQPGGPPQTPPAVLSLCKNATAGAMVAEVCRRQGWAFTGLHYQDRPVWDVAPYVQAADIVVASGRGAREGLACNRPTYVFDVRDQSRGPRADGWLTPETVEALMAKNCSTRTGDRPTSVDDLEAALYAPPNGAWGRAWVEAHANLDTQMQQYMTLTKDLLHDRTDDDAGPPEQRGQVAQAAAG